MSKIDRKNVAGSRDDVGTMLTFHQFRSNLVCSFVIYIGLRIQTHPLIHIHYPIIFGSDIDTYISLLHSFGHIGIVYQNFAPIRSLFVVFVLVLVHIDIASISYLEPTTRVLVFKLPGLLFRHFIDYFVRSFLYFTLPHGSCWTPDGLLVTPGGLLVDS